MSKSNEAIVDCNATTATPSRRCWYHKYNKSLRLLLPCRPTPKDKTTLPSNRSGCLSFAALGWLSPLMWKAYRNGIDQMKLWKLPVEDTSQVNADRLERLWEEEIASRGAKASFPRTVWRFIQTRTIVAIFLVFLYSIINVITPSWLFKILVNYIETGDTDLKEGFYIVGIMALVQLARITVFSGSYTFSAHTAMRIQGAIKLFLYRKALRLRHRGDQHMSQIVNDITVETDRVFEATSRGISSFSTVIIFIFILFYSVFTIGVWSFLGVAVLLAALPLTTLLARKSANVRRNAVPHTQQRIHVMNEVLTSIRLIKMYAWEDSFAKKVSAVRSMERKILQTSAFIHSVSQTTAPVICIIAACATFLGHTLSNKPLSASQAFSIFSVFSAARVSLATTTNNSKYMADAIIGCRRMQKLLLSSEATSPTNKAINEVHEAIVIRKALFAWKECSEPIKEPTKKPTKKPKKEPTKEPAKEPSKEGIDNVAYDSDAQENTFNSTGNMSNMNLTIPKGTLVGLCGSVGSGKSSLLAAIYGDMILAKGELGVAGPMAYVPQQTWVCSGTLKENVLFGRPLEKNRYESILEACSLLSDISLLPCGDETEIGERGVNLSGGQRQRLNLARALYSNRDIYLLDDPLSAVDTRVAKHIFRQAIQGILRGKTVLLVTHGINFLEQCDTIVVLDNGCIVEEGDHKHLLCSGGRYAQMFNLSSTKRQRRISVKNEDNTEEEEEEEVKEESNNKENDASKGRLVTPEDVKHGEVTVRTYIEYLKASGGYFVCLFVFIIFLLHLGTMLFNSIWLQRWLDDGDGFEGSPFQRKLIPLEGNEHVVPLSQGHVKRDTNTTNASSESYYDIHHNHENIVDNPLLWMYALVYGMSVVVLVITGLLQSYFSTLVALVASSNLHDNMFKRVLHGPMHFFDTTPVGRILNRFSKDMDELDYTFPFQLGYVLQYSLAVIGQMALIGFIYPWCCIALVIILALIILLDTWLHAGIREMKRLESVSRSGIVVHLTSTMQGLSVIRIFGKEAMFIDKFQNYVNDHQLTNMLFYCTMLWFAFRMEILCSILITVTGVLVILDAGTTSPALAGLALASSFQVTQIITGLIRNKSDLKARFTAVERIVEYTKGIPQEPQGPPKCRRMSTIKRRLSVFRQRAGTITNAQWPSDGSIDFNDVCLSYRPGLPLVLRGVTCHIKGGERIGIIGRTGAGKSSLIGTLLRLVEIDSGSITIDDVNIKTVGLHQLRSAISVIPQEPVLFQGTIRYNLDPFNEHADEAIWNALEKSYLKEKVSNETKQLEAVVDADGDNFSVGEKQLVCLARTILRKNKILLLDEATAFVDVETDHKIQRTIRESFSDCTVLTIAHRLNTIWDSNRILVMDAGQVAEFDSPETLMTQKHSFFRAMMQAMGVTHLDQLRRFSVVVLDGDNAQNESTS